MITVSTITTPDSLSPVLNSNIWFRFNSASSSVSNFKYVVNLNHQLEPFGLTYIVDQRYKVPPRPLTGECQYTPHKYLESFFGYKPTPFISDWTPVDNGLVRFEIDYGFEYNPNFTFADTFNSGGALGLSFSSAVDIQVGDTIKISKDNKQVNSFYDGFCEIDTVLSSTQFVTNKVFGATYTPETGLVTSLLRVNQTTDSYDAFYGVRQYNERTRDYGLEYPIGVSPTSKVLTNYPDTSKPTLLEDYESLSLILNNYTRNTLIVDGYDANGNLIATHSNVISITNSYYRLDIGVGPQNIIADTGSASFFDGVDNYDVYVQNDAALRIRYTVTSVGVLQLIEITPAGQYNGTLYWTWNDGSFTYFLWWDGVQDWYISSALGGGTLYLVSNPLGTPTPTSYLPTAGNIINSDWLLAGPSFFDFFTLSVPSPTAVTEFQNYKIVENCSIYDNVRLVFLNRLGGYDYFNFTLDSKSSLNIERSTFKKLLDFDYSIGDRGETTFAQKGEETLVINSDWITEEESVWLEELVSSREAFQVIGTDIYPIQILDTTYEVKSKLREQIFNLSITFKYSFNKNI